MNIYIMYLYIYLLYLGNLFLIREAPVPGSYFAEWWASLNPKHHCLGSDSLAVSSLLYVALYMCYRKKKNSRSGLISPFCGIKLQLLMLHFFFNYAIFFLGWSKESSLSLGPAYASSILRIFYFSQIVFILVQDYCLYLSDSK